MREQLSNGSLVLVQNLLSLAGIYTFGTGKFGDVIDALAKRDTKDGKAIVVRLTYTKADSLETTGY